MRRRRRRRRTRRDSRGERDEKSGQVGRTGRCSERPARSACNRPRNLFRWRPPFFFFFPFFFPHPPPLTLFLQSSSLFHRRGFFFWFSSRIKNKNKNKNKTKHNNLLKNEKGVWMPRRTLGSNGSFIWHRVIKRSKKRWNTKKIRLTRRVLNPPRPPNPPPTPPYFRYRSKSHRNQVRRRAESSLDLIGSLSLVFATGLFRNRSLFLKGKRKKKNDANRKLIVWFVTFGSNHFLPGSVAKKKRKKRTNKW